MTAKIQTSFSAGELSSSLFARVDLAKFQVGAARLYNLFVDYRGGASNRAGLQLVARGYDSAHPIRLIRFQFSTIQNYQLEFGHFYMRVIKNGAPVLETAKVISAITNANPGVITSNGHGYADGDQVYFPSVLGMTQLNQKEYFVTGSTVNTFSLLDWNGNPVNTSGYGAFTSGTVARIYRIASPYDSADLFKLKFTQSADTMTICHPSYASYDLTRSSETNWTFTQVVIGSAIAAPVMSSVTVAPATAGNTNYQYVVTAVNAAGEESIASNIGSAVNGIDIRATSGSVAIAWAAVSDAVAYNVYKALPANNSAIPTGVLFGYMTTVTGTAAVDTNITPDFTATPPTHQNPFAGNNFPGTVTYFSQRKVYAGSTAYPETFEMSKPGQFKNFDVGSIVEPDDAISGTLVSRQVNAIKYMLSMPNGLIMLTSGGAWQVSGSNGVVSPATIQATPQAYNGCGDVEPLTINYEILYVQEKGTIVRDLSYNFYTNIYTGTDLSVLSNHLFYGYSIIEWAYAEEPFKLVWAVRSDGQALSMTYLKEQEVAGWAQHATDGSFESVSVIQEGQEDVVYFVVNRTIGGQSIRFIERIHTRLMPNGAEDAFFVDCGLSYSGSPTTTLSGLDHLEGESVAVLGDGNVFPNQTVNNGAIMLSQPVSKAAVGLPIPSAQLKTLYLSIESKETIQGKRKNIVATTVRMAETRGLKVGQDFSQMDEIKERDLNTIGSAIDLYTGDAYLPIPGGWTTGGQLCLQQDYPLPCTILGVIPEFEIGDDTR